MGGQLRQAGKGAFEQTKESKSPPNLLKHNNESTAVGADGIAASSQADNGSPSSALCSPG